MFKNKRSAGADKEALVESVGDATNSFVEIDGRCKVTGKDERVVLVHIGPGDVYESYFCKDSANYTFVTNDDPDTPILSQIVCSNLRLVP